MNTRTSAVVAALSHTRSANAQPRLSRSHEPITSEPFIAKFRALIMIANPRLSQPCGVARTARSINASSEQITTRRSEEHTSELQSQSNLVCRLLLEKKKRNAPSHLNCMVQ